MSTVLSDFPAPARSTTHQWASWFDGRIHQLERGVDFDNEPKRFRAVAKTAAWNRGLMLRTAVRGDTVTLQVTGPREVAP